MPGSQACSGPLKDGSYWVYGASEDNAGNTETPGGVAVKIDSQAPTSTVSGVSTDWTATPQTVTLTATDALSGVAGIRYAIGTGAETPDTVYDPSNQPVLENGEQISWAATDNAGNVEAIQTIAIAQVDTVPPDAPAVTERPDATTTDTSATFAFTTGRATLRCSLDGATPTACDASFTLRDLAVGPHSLRVLAQDHVGNQSTPTVIEWTITRPAPAPTPLTTKSLTFSLQSKSQQLLLNKRAVPVTLNCGGVACSVTVTSELRVKATRSS